ncbi:hypothetical protein A1Q1_07947 [Trichosporon asahii var. asahii CBS 2479]|uniref:Uncharacterized protein n=1 Tax=Trichosporon asahii var. asahii (strain ATCC 90039 / CBS 2479 / JCM 2466 / KCTC 7840 / NBRC 103889/ NCYC 2677 / UAMH 7654) TaxID=1186058 RepID=J4UH63_TRIAS|nr:hypothetical protein A1Q1_07947 [Trichosporon asahii var. asahii CBS 2479]EJT50885.1 hypothetical protein A1Q1_07947 [Trichosporon asahii var. asahii CBS 2479]
MKDPSYFFTDGLIDDDMDDDEFGEDDDEEDVPVAPDWNTTLQQMDDQNSAEDDLKQARKPGGLGFQQQRARAWDF